MSQNNQKKEKTNSAFEMPKFEVPNLEVPAAFRDIAEKTVAQTRENYERLKQAAEDTTSVLENSYTAYSNGTLALTNKIIDNAQANINAMFSFTKSLLEVKTVAEAVEKQTSFARSQFETLTTQGRELQEIATQVANDTSAPVKAAAEKATAQFKKTA